MNTNAKLELCDSHEVDCWLTICTLPPFNVRSEVDDLTYTMDVAFEFLI